MAISETGVPTAVRARERPGLVATMLGSLADLLLPPVCIVCRTRIGVHGLICGACFAEIDFIAAPLCERLGVPLPYETGGANLSASAIANPPAYDRARAAARYSATMRDLIQSFKYRDRHEGLEAVVAAVQSIGLLAQEAGRLSGVAVDCFVLKRVRATMSQVGLSAKQRKRNVAGAFRLDPAGKQRIKGKRVIVVDDVITTGATVEACAKTLKRGGAAHVDVLALARAVEPTAFML